MAAQVASLYGVLALDDKDFIKGLGVAKSGILDLEGSTKQMGNGLLEGAKRLSGKLTEIGGQLSLLGDSINTLLGPLVDFGSAAVDAAVDFDESMKNIQAAAGYTNEEMVGIHDQVLAIGEASRYGPAEAALAFYEIAGGVTDASSRMAIFEASVKAAQAGNAELASTTSAMIGLMNSYGLGTEGAAFASDVLTRTVGMGKGSMDEFGASLAKAAMLAPGLDIGLDDLASSMAYMTTKNIPAAESATMLKNMMTTLLSPTKDLADAIHAAGYESGEAMIKAEGLVGAYEILKENNNGTLSGLITNTEALTGATTLATEEFTKFDEAFKGSTISTWNGQTGLMAGMNEFSEGIQGATTVAEDVQMSSTAAQFDLLTASVDGLKVALGDNLMPILDSITNEMLLPLVQGIKDWVSQNPQAATTVMLVAGAVSLLAFGLTAAGVALTAMGTGLALLLSPIGLAILAAVLLAAAYFTNFGGIKDFIDGTVRPAIEGFFNFLADVWELVRPGIEDLRNGFETAMTTIESIIAKPEEAIQAVIDLVKGWWAGVKAGVDEFANGITKGLEPAVSFINGVSDAINSVGAALGLVQTSVAAGGTLDTSFAMEGNAAGGPVYAGVPSIVGEQGREIFIPESNGRIVSNTETEGMMGGVSIGNVTIYANSAQGGRDAADAFDVRLKEKLASRG